MESRGPQKPIRYTPQTPYVPEVSSLGKGPKALVRESIRARWRLVGQDERAAASAAVCDQVRRQAIWRQARHLLFYAARSDELELESLMKEGLREGRIVALPRFDTLTGTYEAVRILDVQSDLIPGLFGIREPDRECPIVPLKQLDLVVVPGLGFDQGGRRLGRGKGYYDRLLSSAGGIFCGVAMDWQVLTTLPVEDHDKLVHCIVTPSRWLEINQPTT